LTLGRLEIDILKLDRYHRDNMDRVGEPTSNVTRRCVKRERKQKFITFLSLTTRMRSTHATIYIYINT